MGWKSDDSDQPIESVRLLKVRTHTQKTHMPWVVGAKRWAYKHAGMVLRKNRRVSKASETGHVRQEKSKVREYNAPATVKNSY